MKYVCIKELILSKITQNGYSYKFNLNDKIKKIKIINEEGYRDKRINFFFDSNQPNIPGECSFYMPARKFNKHFKSEANLRQDRINEILNG